MRQLLTREQIESFDHNGYLVLRNWLSADLISRLCEASNEAISRGLHNGQSERVATVSTDNEQFVTRINDLFCEGDPVFLELLGCPEIVNVAESLVGENCISTYESLVVRNKGDGQNIVWHRDMVHERESRIFTLGVYLDESRKGKGALRVFPETQNSDADVCTFEDELKRGERHPVEIEINAGDVLLHDVMLVHSSESILEQEFRRTVYFEFRSQAQSQTNTGFPAEWIGLRGQLIELTHKRWQMNNERSANNDFDEWSNEEEELIAKMYSIKTQIEPGQYCFRG